ncbi:esterase-like activity of phytase-domain-containing protein [Pavlovales sp. CCMP2436]|nr:esterase-like activity of phytase-domain-containing protein [Pavlovales sp. CCMP2436]
MPQRGSQPNERGAQPDVGAQTIFRGSVLFSLGSRFADESSGKELELAELSACRWDPSDSTGTRVAFLSDSGVLWHADVEISEQGELKGVRPRRWRALSRPGGWIDSEGLDYLDSDGSKVLVSSELHALPLGGLSKLDIALYDVASGLYERSPFEVPAHLRATVVDNGGFEGLAHTADGEKFVSANEYALSVDAVVFRRLLLFNGSTPAPKGNSSAPSSTFSSAPYEHPLAAMLPYVPASEAFGVVEFSEHPFSGTRVLSLERAHSTQDGNDVRLFEIDFSQARDVSCCPQLYERSRGRASPQCVLKRSAQPNTDEVRRTHNSRLRHAAGNGRRSAQTSTTFRTVRRQLESLSAVYNK